MNKSDVRVMLWSRGLYVQTRGVCDLVCVCVCVFFCCSVFLFFVCGCFCFLQEDLFRRFATYLPANFIFGLAFLGLSWQVLEPIRYLNPLATLLLLTGPTIAASKKFTDICLYQVMGWTVQQYQYTGSWLLLRTRFLSFWAVQLFQYAGTIALLVSGLSFGTYSIPSILVFIARLGLGQHLLVFEG